MNSPRFAGRSCHQRAFTLIELLVVITIIAVLAGLLLPVIGKVQENAKKVSTKHTELQIVSAVNSYQTEYGQYPVAVVAGSTPKDTTFGLGPNGDNKTLFNVLRALNATDTDANVKALNSRQIVYFESKNVKNVSSPRDGFVVTTPATGNPKNTTPVNLVTGDLVDAWGNRYMVRIDSGYTNGVVNPYSSGGDTDTADDQPDTTTGPTQAQLKEWLRTGVISWTYGSDGIKGSTGSTFTAPYTPTPGDDVDSWQ